MAIHQWQGLPPVTATLDGLLVATSGSQNLWVNLKMELKCSIIWTWIFFPGWFVQRIPLKCWICDPKKSFSKRLQVQELGAFGRSHPSVTWGWGFYTLKPTKVWYVSIPKINQWFIGGECFGGYTVLLYPGKRPWNKSLHEKKNVKWYNHQH